LVCGQALENIARANSIPLPLHHLEGRILMNDFSPEGKDDLASTIVERGRSARANYMGILAPERDEVRLAISRMLGDAQ
jgi:hypothetical protein